MKKTKAGRTLLTTDEVVLPEYIIPTVKDWFQHIEPEGWMSRGYKIEKEKE